jgi:hypothetical protein
VGSDGLPGVAVAHNIKFNFNAFLGQERTGGDVTIAVDPKNSATVYVAYGAMQGNTYTLHVCRSVDSGATWSADLCTIPSATNPALAINNNSIVGFLYQQLTGSGNKQRWVTHLQRTSDGSHWTDLVLSTVPAKTPVKQFDPYIGDYIHLQSVGTDFYGVFCANNTPSNANFPSGVVYQRNANFNTQTLLDTDGVTHVPVSIDPFYFKVSD